jgi:DNA helicase-2/ATP-dependent DNA helicase PcrA
MDILDGLNPQQLQAVTTTEGCVRVIAGAGSGKTGALARRYAYLVSQIGILPENILCATFSNKAANEMKKRVRALVGDCDTGYISTFHSFCVTVLQEDISAVNYPKNFIVLDNPDIDAMLTTVYEERGLTMREMTFSRARDMIEMQKLVWQPDYYEAMIDLSLEQLRQKYMQANTAREIIFWGYVYQEKKCFALDYNDLLKFVLYIFKTVPEIRDKWCARMEYIMVDEYQDIDEIQYQLMKALCARHGNLFIVGDPDQTIYTWRGASVRYLLDFQRDFPNVKTILMTTNYRSTPQILNVANSLIDKNVIRVKKELVPTRPAGEQVVYHHAKTNQDEAQWIGWKIHELMDHGVPGGDIAVLYRAHYLSRALEDVFLRQKVPYVLYSGAQFFDRAEVKDALAYLRMVVYRDDLSFARTINNPKRNIGRTRMEFLRQYAGEKGCPLYTALLANLESDRFRGTGGADFVEVVERWGSQYENMSVSDLLGRVLDDSGYEAALRLEGSQTRLDNLAELKQCVHEYEISCGEECTAERFLSSIALMTNLDTAENRGAVKLMTVHTAKGLEFPYVFLCGLDEGIFPSKKTATRDAMEEERRLAFVAVTRARDGLFLTDAEGKNLDGSYRYPSRFLFNIDRQLLHYTNELDAGLVYDAQNAIDASERMLTAMTEDGGFQVGDRVRHAIMGKGKIVDIDRQKNAYVVQFDDLSTTRRISFKAKLERA